MTEAAHAADRIVIQAAAERMALIGRLLDVDDALARWEAGDQIQGGVAADALDQALGLLSELRTGDDAARLVECVERVVASLPPPLE
jgi:hypothetical protein